MSSAPFRPEVVREQVAERDFGVVAKPLTVIERIYGNGLVRKLTALAVIPMSVAAAAKLPRATAATSVCNAPSFIRIAQVWITKTSLSLCYHRCSIDGSPRRVSDRIQGLAWVDSSTHHP